MFLVWAALAACVGATTWPACADDKCVDTYPVKSQKLTAAPSVAWYTDWRNEQSKLDQFFGGEGLIGTHLVYSISTSDGGFAVCGVGEESEPAGDGSLLNNAIAAKFTSAWPKM